MAPANAWTHITGSPIKSLLSVFFCDDAMTDPRPQLAILRDPRLAAHALAPAPAWLWSPDADRILWANPAGAAIFDASSPGDAALLRFDANHSASIQAARLSATLAHGGAPRLERLRGFGASIGATLVCLCSRITLADDSTAILIASAERAGKTLSLPDRATRLLHDFDSAAAIFTPDGEIIAAQPAALFHRRAGDRPGMLTRTTYRFDDPIAATGTQHERLQKYCEARDQIDARLNAWLADMREQQCN